MPDSDAVPLPSPVAPSAGPAPALALTPPERRRMRLTALMISKRLADAAVPMSLLADHPSVQFNYLRPGIGTVGVEMH